MKSSLLGISGEQPLTKDQETAGAPRKKTVKSFSPQNVLVENKFSRTSPVRVTEISVGQGEALSRLQRPLEKKFLQNLYKSKLGEARQLQKQNWYLTWSPVKKKPHWAFNQNQEVMPFVTLNAESSNSYTVFDLWQNETGKKRESLAASWP